MQETYTQNKTFDRIDFSKPTNKRRIRKKTAFLTVAILLIVILMDLNSLNVNSMDAIFSLVRLSKTAFQESKFIDCKMLGLRFDTCNEFGPFRLRTANLITPPSIKQKIKTDGFQRFTIA